MLRHLLRLSELPPLHDAATINSTPSPGGSLPTALWVAPHYEHLFCKIPFLPFLESWIMCCCAAWAIAAARYDIEALCAVLRMALLGGRRPGEIGDEVKARLTTEWSKLGAWDHHGSEEESYCRATGLVLND